MTPEILAAIHHDWQAIEPVEPWTNGHTLVLIGVGFFLYLMYIMLATPARKGR